MEYREYPLPQHYDPNKVGEVWRVPYHERAQEAHEWSKRHKIQPAAWDVYKLGLLLIDVQNTFCIPGYELFVGGRSGMGAVDDNRRLCQFIYKNIGIITEITATLDTHDPFQIFHAVFFVNDAGEHPGPHTQITVKDVESGRWKFNATLAETLDISKEYGRQYILHYTSELASRGKYDLTIWPYHAIKGGIGHALVSTIEEAVFFHSICRHARMELLSKGDNAFTEHYSVLGPEVNLDPIGKQIVPENNWLLEKLGDLDALIVAGQAKSHCLAWSISDLLDKALERDPGLLSKIYLLEDCTSPVVVPGVVDYTDYADSTFERFSKAGIHIVRSSESIEEWPGIQFGKPG